MWGIAVAVLALLLAGPKQIRVGLSRGRIARGQRMGRYGPSWSWRARMVSAGGSDVRRLAWRVGRDLCTGLFRRAGVDSGGEDFSARRAARYEVPRKNRGAGSPRWSFAFLFARRSLRAAQRRRRATVTELWATSGGPGRLRRPIHPGEAHAYQFLRLREITPDGLVALANAGLRDESPALSSPLREG